MIRNIKELKNIIANRENGLMEFKETTGQLERAMETLCAFLNGKGGTVLFGVTDKGKVIGQEVSDTTQRNIAEAINRLEPLTEVQVSYVELPDSDKKVIVLHVEEARFERPFCYKGRAYVRIESVTTIMQQVVYNELLMQREGLRHFWESCPNPNLNLSDLDDAEIMKTVRLGVEYGRLPETIGNDIPAILEKLGVMENNVLTHAAAILFANRKLKDYPQCLLKLARFKGTDKTVFMDNQRIHGNLFLQLDAAMTFIFKHLSLSGTTDTLEREEHLSIPYKAIREGVVNSLCHRSWRDVSGAIAIAIYDDRLEIENPGSFPVGWSLEKIKSQHGSKPQNPVIADVLYMRKVLESWGRGIGMMMEECQKANLPEPEYLLSANEVKLIFRYEPTRKRPESDQKTTGKRPENDRKATKYQPETDQVPTGKRPENDRKATRKRPGNDQIKVVYELIKANPQISRMELSEKTGLHDSSVKRRLKVLTEKGVIQHIGPDKGGSWKIIRPLSEETEAERKDSMN